MAPSTSPARASASASCKIVVPSTQRDDSNLGVSEVSSPPSAPANPGTSTQVILGFAVLYLVWGSTYLAMRIAAESLPPFELASIRFLISGAALLAWSIARQEPIAPRSEWARAAVVALFLLVGGNGSVVWAVQHVPSGVAALLVATTPLWLAVFAREPITRTLVLGLVLGFIGIGILMGPERLGSGRIDPLGAVVLVFASISWAIGSLIQRAGKSASASQASGMQMLFGSVFLFLVSRVAGEHLDLPHVTARSLAALAYLTVFGSLVGFTTYAWLMKRQPPSRVATYAYVNPVVAVVLGAAFGGEAISGRVLIAAAVIIAGVVAILWRRR
jgi:drug/metabolite transporter (DMT)-like permease